MDVSRVARVLEGDLEISWGFRPQLLRAAYAAVNGVETHSKELHQLRAAYAAVNFKLYRAIF